VAVLVSVVVEVENTVAVSVFWVVTVMVVYTTDVAVIVGEASVTVVEDVAVVVDSGIFDSMQEQPAESMLDAMPATQEEKGLRLVVEVVLAVVDGAFEGVVDDALVVGALASRFAFSNPPVMTVVVVVVVVVVVGLRRALAWTKPKDDCSYWSNRRWHSIEELDGTHLLRLGDGSVWKCQGCCDCGSTWAVPFNQHALCVTYEANVLTR
jgi:hypothetical protein